MHTNGAFSFDQNASHLYPSKPTVTPCFPFVNVAFVLFGSCRIIVFASSSRSSLIRVQSRTSIEAAFYDWLLEDLSQEEKETFQTILDKVYAKSKKESRLHFPNVMQRIQTL